MYGDNDITTSSPLFPFWPEFACLFFISRLPSFSYFLFVILLLAGVEMYNINISVIEAK